MSIHRIYGVLLRHVFLFKRSLDRLTDAFFWPVVDLALWGLTSSFIGSQTDDPSAVIVLVVSGILFWLIVYRGQLEVSMTLLEDLWNRNLVNMFVAPLKFSEALTAFMILAFLKAFVSFVFGVFIAFWFYKVQLFSNGFMMLWYLVPLFLTAWWTGFVITGLIFRYGTRIQSFGWTIVWILAPFSAIYFPVTALPSWAQVIASFVPTSYVFEGMRKLIETGVFDTYSFLVSVGLSIVLFVLSIVFLKMCFNSALMKKGLVKVY